MTDLVCDRYDVSERLCKLENKINTHFSFHQVIEKELWNRVQGRIEKLENDLHNHYKNVADLISNISISKKIPYKCPVCLGTGRYKLATANCPSDIKDCHACEGKGVVWG